MRIVHLVNHCRLGHGNAHLAVDLACAQAAHGDAVAYLSEGGDFEGLLAEAGVAHRALRQRTRNPFVAAASALRLAAFLRGFRADIVHAHMMSGALLGFIATRLGRARLVTTVHNSFDAHSGLMRVGDLVVAVSEAERSHLVERGFPASKVVAVLNGPLFGARVPRDAPAPPDLPRPSVTTLCGLHPRKGVDDLIRAFALVAPRHRAAHLNIVGDGPERAALAALAAELGLAGRVRFHGEVGAPQGILRATDVFVLASRSEPFGLVNLEARSAGCAMIGTAVGGIPEALEHGRAGLLVPPRDPPALARALDDLLGDPDALAAFRAAALRGIERFGVDRMRVHYRDAYEAVRADRRNPRAALASGQPRRRGRPHEFPRPSTEFLSG